MIIGARATILGIMLTHSVMVALLIAMLACVLASIKDQLQESTCHAHRPTPSRMSASL
jgi:hypothetical protein